MNPETNPNVYQAQEFVNKAIALAVLNNKSELVKLLQKNGVKVDGTVSDKDLITMIYVGIAKSASFKKDLLAFFNSMEANGDLLGFTGDGQFFNGSGKPFGETAFGKALGENSGAILAAGIGILSQKLTAKSDQASFKAAAELEAAKTQALLAQAAAAQSVGATSGSSKKWVLPVVIGVLVIGIGAFFMLKKRK